MKLNLPTTACDPKRLELFLSGDLGEAQERHFTIHLNTCESCRLSLAGRAAEPEAWREAEVLLKPSQFDSQDIADLDQPTRQPLQIQNVLDALGPTDDPEMLGRLGGYEVTGVVGAGGMGVVLKAIDKSLDRTVAIKVMAPHLATSGAARKRFGREAKAAAAVLHPNVIAIHSVSNDEPLPYLVMPYVRGTSLQRRLDREGPLSLQEVLRIGAQIAAGLAAAHAQGLVHRDIKPANILLEDGIERVTITDFGLARAVDDATITHSGMIAGTPQFMSPEQARGEAVDARSDLFSLGSVLYAICTGRPPFRAETSYGVMRRITDDEPKPIRELNPDVPAWLCRIISKLMSKQAADRYESAAEVAELLEQCLAHVQQPAVARLPASLQPQAKPRFFSLSRRWSGVIAMIATFGFALLGLFAWQATEAPDIAGNWSGDEWGQVVMKKTSDGEYSGTYSDTFKENPGTIEVQWSRLERRYKGTWRENEDRHGKISLRLVDDEIRGAWTTSQESGINPGRPELADLAWQRAVATPATEIQVKIAAPERMEIAVADQRGQFGKSSPPFVAPARLNLMAGKTHRLKLTQIAGREGAEFYPTVEIGPTSPGSATFLAHNFIPVAFTEEDFDQTLAGNLVTKVIYLPDPEFQELAVASVEALVSTRLDPGKDPIVEAGRRGSILAIVRLGNKDIALPDGARIMLGGKPDETRLWNTFGVTREPVSPLTAKVLEWSGLHLNPITSKEFRDKNVLAKYPGGLDVTFCRSHGPAEKAGVNEVDIVVGLQGRALTTLKELDAAVQDAVEQVKRGEADALQWDVLRDGETIQINVPFPVSELALESPAASGATNADSNAVLPKRLHFFTTDEKVKLVACSPDGKLIAVATDQSTLPSPQIDWKRAALIMDAESGKVTKLQITTPAEYSQLAANRGTPRSEVTAIAFSPDGSLLAIGTSLGQVKLFNPHTGEAVPALDDEKARPAENEVLKKLTAVKRALGSVASLAFSPDGSLLATCGGSFEDVPFDRSDRERLGANGPGRLKVWEVRSGTLKHDLAGHSDAAAVAFSADGKLLASAGSWSGPEHGSGVIVWNPETGEKLRTIEQKANGGVRSIVFGPDKTLLAFAALEFDKDSDTKSTRIVVAHGGSGITEWQQSIPRGATVEGFSPAGKRIVVLTHGRSVEFFDTETGQANHEINLANSPETLRWADLSVASRGNMLAIGGVGKDRKGSVEIWTVPFSAGERASPDEVPATAESSSQPGDLQFSEPQEIVLSMNSTQFMLDLDTGKTMDPPATVRPEQAQMDLHPNQVQPYHFPTALVGRELSGMEMKESDWHASAAEVRLALEGKGVEPLKEMDQGPEKHPTYFFKTRDGACGVLQLLEVVDKPKGMRLRYKTIERKPAAEQRGEVLTPKQIVERGQKLSHSKQRIVVRMKVAANKPITLVDEKGSQHEYWTLFDADTAEFSIRITDDGHKALLRQAGLARIPKLFVGEWIEVEGTVYGVERDFVSRRDAIRTYHVDLNSLDQVSVVAPPAESVGASQRDSGAKAKQERIAAEEKVPGTALFDSPLSAEPKPGQIVIDLYGVDISEMAGDAKLLELMKSLNMLEGVTVNTSPSHNGENGISAAVRDRYGIFAKESKESKKESTLQAAINQALRAGGITAIRWTQRETVDSAPEMSEQEKAVAKLVLVFFDDKSRRAVPCLVLSVGDATFAITASPATVVPDGTAHAVDRTFLEPTGKQPIRVEYDPRSTTEFFVCRTKEPLAAIQLKDTAAVTEGDFVTAVSMSRVAPQEATVVGLGRRIKFELPDRNIQRWYEDLIEVDQTLPEGTPLFKDGQLVGLVLLGTRYAGEDAKKSYVVPAARIVQLCGRLGQK